VPGLSFAGMKRAIVSVTNDLATDNRVARTCEVLVSLGHEVLLVGRHLPGSLPLDRPYRTRRMRLLFHKGPLFYAEYNLRLFFLLLFSRCSLLISNDLDTLLPNFLVARLCGKKLVYDTHEFYTEVPELVARPRVRAVWLAIERSIFPKLNVITVNQSIANANTRSATAMNCMVVRNIPMPRALGPLPSREELGLPAGRFLGDARGRHQRAARGGRSRAGHEGTTGLPVVDHRWGRCLARAGALGAGARPAGPRAPPRQDALRPHDGLYTRNADLGLTLDKDTNLNYRFSLPNKLFDYLHAGIPVLATDLPEVAAIVREH
jgi:hypothetical protein